MDRRLLQIVLAALEKPPAERAAFLDEACGNDLELRAQAERMLARGIPEDSFLSHTLGFGQVSTGLGGAFATVAVAMGEHRRGNVFADADIGVGSCIGSYEILAPIAAGGMGMIFEAKHKYLERRVALKTPAPRARRAAFNLLREAQALAILDHPHVLRVHDAGLHDDSPYFVVELLRGETLQARLSREQRLPPQRVMDLLEEVGSAIDAHHARGLVHRDIKPGNIWIRQDGTFCLFDYGLAIRDTEPSTDEAICGTPAYMSPEQARGQVTDVRSDLFQLGLVARQCLSGSVLRGRVRGSFDDFLRAIQEERLPPLAESMPGLPRGLGDIIDGMTRARPLERYVRAGDMLRDLADLRYGGRRPPGPCGGTAFIAMPFDRSFDRVLDAIHSACFANRLRGRRLDHVEGVQDIWNAIEKEIRDARVVIADFSPVGIPGAPNSNVVTEAAHARALGKPVLLITRSSPERLPFDWRQAPSIRYGRGRRALQRLTELLTGRVRHYCRTMEASP